MIPQARPPMPSSAPRRLDPPLFALPTLRPSHLLPLPRPERLPFPLTDPRTEFFYFGRNAVWHAIRRLGLTGCPVLVPAYHHGVEVEALVDAGAKPVFYGIDRSFQPDLAQIDRLARDGARALYVIHFAGFPQPMDDLLSIARAHGLKVIEDCALSLLSADGARPLGARSDAAIFCFYKTLPVPNGGALWMPKKHVPLRLRRPPVLAVANQTAASLLQGFEFTGGARVARLRQRVRRVVRAANAVITVDRLPVGTRHFDPSRVDVGISPVSLAVARRLDHSAIVEQRRRNYYALLARVRDLSSPLIHELPTGTCPLFYPLWCEDKSAVRQRLASEGVEAIDFWRNGSPLVPEKAFPEVEALRRHVLELPIHQDLGAPEMDALASAVRRALQ